MTFISKFLLFFILLTAHSSYAGMRSVSLQFYTAQIPITFDETICQWHQSITQNILSEQPFSRIEAYRASTLLPGLLNAKKTYRLNDWLFLQLVEQSVKTVLPKHTNAEHNLLTAFIFYKAGWDVLPFVSGEDIHLYFHCLQLAYVSYMEQNGRLYYNLTNSISETSDPLFEFDLPQNPDAKPFSLDLKVQPNLPAKTAQRTFEFHFRDSIYQLNLELDHTRIGWMRKYPTVENAAYIDAPLSPALEKSLLLALQQHTQHLSNAEKLDFLVAFTRSLPYKVDHLAYGEEKPMISDEVLYYPFSDCEDRASLLMAMIKAFIPMPTIALSYPEHISIAVELPELPGANIPHKNKRFVLCDPTGPAGISLFHDHRAYSFGNQYEVILTFML